MSIILDTPPDPKFQRVHNPLPDYKMEELHSQLLHKIEIGLASEGLKFRRRRPGLRIQHGPAVIHLWLDYYLDERWWKIMVGQSPPCDIHAPENRTADFDSICLQRGFFKNQSGAVGRIPPQKPTRADRHALGGRVDTPVRERTACPRLPR
jgi:hypothetical protein